MKWYVPVTACIIYNLHFICRIFHCLPIQLDSLALFGVGFNVVLFSVLSSFVYFVLSFPSKLYLIQWKINQQKRYMIHEKPKQRIVVISFVKQCEHRPPNTACTLQTYYIITIYWFHCLAWAQPVSDFWVCFFCFIVIYFVW